MKPAVVLLGLVLLLETAYAAEESCVDRCGSFSIQSKCQCDSLCVYYGSCCQDFDTICPKKIARGDTFQVPEDITEAETTPQESVTTLEPIISAPPATTPDTLPPITSGPTLPPADPDAVPCSGRPFDAFLQLKNGSIYAFRGEYFFELDDESILPGYPKLIQDVWGIKGPIDAAFTRINCQGKSYIFKGNKYWRFEGDVLDEDFPRNISVGFDGIPDSIDAAFALQAPSHLGKEKAYFFKGNKYHLYEFKHQPSHEECVQMTRSSPSLLFAQYTNLFCDNTWEEFLTELFGSSVGSRYTGPRFISKDWRGIPAFLDAAMVGQVHLSPKPMSPPPTRRRSRRRKKLSKKKQGRQSRSVFYDDFFGLDSLFDIYFGDNIDMSTAQESKSTPLQNVYFFKRDKYYRVDLQTKRVDSARPPYPRSIAKYWLGCELKGSLDTSREEKK